MDFGRVTPAELERVDFKLPADPKETTKVLKASKSKKPPLFYFGCAKWGRKDWVGKLYPPKTKEADFLNWYAKYFNCIELNATFYKLPDERTMKIWKEKAGKGFMFSPKFTATISQSRRLVNAERETDEFLKGVHALGDSLGPCFLQMHPTFGPKSLDAVKNYLAYLPTDLEMFFEVRHPDWFVGDNFKALSKVLEDAGKGFVITDTAGRRDVCHMRLTTPTAFIRFVGNSLHKSDYQRIDDWVERIDKWVKDGLTHLYFFMHQHDELHSPELIKYTIQRINERCGLDIPVPVYLYEQEAKGLFD
jgi:uncharacterized protein YecE (DUF72 family)